MVIIERDQEEIYTREKCFITELLNSSEIINLSIARARVEPGTTTECHKLGVDEAYYILEGEGIMLLNDEAKKKVKKGHLVFIPKGSSQQITNPAQTDLIFLCICTPRFTASTYTPWDSSSK